jgi:hypothetical protein
MVISAIVRPQPMHRPESGSTTQIFTQGLRGGRSEEVIGVI